MSERVNVIQIQGEKLCKQLNMPPGTKIPKDIIELVAKADIYSTITIDGNKVNITPLAIALSKILMSKQVVD